MARQNKSLLIKKIVLKSMEYIFDQTEVSLPSLEFTPSTSEINHIEMLPDASTPNDLSNSTLKLNHANPNL
jgi:hypothetical protein